MFPQAKLRRATEQDLEALHEIWMQDHVNPFMAFEQMPIDRFKPIFTKLFYSSHLYVLEAGGKVVATRRVIYGKDERAHTAEFASFAVHKDYLRGGYGKQFTAELFALIKREHPEIRRIEISQETDNPAALALAKKIGFRDEGVFPDWLVRNTGTRKSSQLVGERFLAYHFNDIPLTDAKPIRPQVPNLKSPTYGLSNLNDKFKVEFKDNIATCRCDSKTLVTCEFDSGSLRYDHIKFLNIKPAPDCSTDQLQQFLEELVVHASTLPNCKKLEIFTHDKKVIEALKNLGFHHRCHKVASYKEGSQYYDEDGFDFAFFDIQNAERFVYQLQLKTGKLKLVQQLGLCTRAIEYAHQDYQIKDFGRLYLQNLAYQMVTSAHDSEHPYHRQAPWENLTKELPDNIRKPFVNLLATLHPSRLPFYAAAAGAVGLLLWGGYRILASGNPCNVQAATITCPPTSRVP